MLGEDWVGPRNSVSVARPFLLYCCRKGGKRIARLNEHWFENELSTCCFLPCSSVCRPSGVLFDVVLVTSCVCWGMHESSAEVVFCGCF